MNSSINEKIIIKPQIKTEFLSLGIIINNSINTVTQGQWWIAAKENTWINEKIQITIGKNRFTFYVNNLDCYYEYFITPNNKYPYILKLYLWDYLHQLNLSVACKTWCGLNDNQILQTLFSQVKYSKFIINCSSIINDIRIQWNESNFNFVERIIGENKKIYWFNNQWFIDSNLPSGKILDNKKISRQITYNNQPPGKIYTYQWPKIYKEPIENYWTLVEHNPKEHQQYYTNKNYNMTYDYNQYYYEDLDISIGDLLNEEKIITIEYVEFHWSWEQWPIIIKNTINDKIFPSKPLMTYYAIITATKSNQLYYNYEKPILGLQKGKVIAINNIHSDKYGRLLVQFYWDTQPQGNYSLTSGPWIPMIQSISRNNYGLWIIPSVNQEVIVDFFNNDCDQPMVIGTVYNHSNTMDNITAKKILLKTHSHHLILDDDDETISITSEKDIKFIINNGDWIGELKQGLMSYNINGNCTFEINGDLNFKVKKDINIESSNVNWRNENQWQLHSDNLIYDVGNKINQSSSVLNINSKNYTMDFTEGKFQGQKCTMEYLDYQLKSTNTVIDITNCNMETTNLTIKSSMASVKSSILMLDGAIFTIKSNMLTMTINSLWTISGNCAAIIKVSLLLINSTSTVVIRGSAPGAIGPFPPYYP